MRIAIEAETRRVRVISNDRIIADSSSALRLVEAGYPDRFYLPLADVTAGLLEPSARRTHCPHKGDANWYDIVLPDQRITDAAWAYPQPVAGAETIAGHCAFDANRVDAIELAETPATTSPGEVGRSA